MYLMTNEYNSAYFEVESEYERDELIERGFKVVEPPLKKKKTVKED
jgi:hypothetical protein